MNNDKARRRIKSSNILDKQNYNKTLASKLPNEFQKALKNYNFRSTESGYCFIDNNNYDNYF